MFHYNDGGRLAAGFTGKTNDCVCRAIAIAGDKPYNEVYAELNEFLRSKRQTRNLKRSSARQGIYKRQIHEYLLSRGYEWFPTMSIGQGCRIHVRANELPSGVLILSLSHHLAAFVCGVLHDTYDSSRNGTRCVYGYWKKTVTCDSHSEDMGLEPSTLCNQERN